MRTIAAVVVGLVLLAAAGLAAWRYGGAVGPAGLWGTRSQTGRGEPAAAYVGSRACAGCRVRERAAWLGSDHAMAMQIADETTVLGDFADRRFVYGAITSTFFQREGRYMVRTDGPDGKLADFEIKYTFGVRPLQQYLIELPGGRLQALSIAWDARPREAGGQRWLHLYPNQKIDYRDELHWTRRQQNWNYMCADCHSTNVRKSYDPAAARYATTWSEINVACEACHGPGSRHVAWASGQGKSAPDDAAKGLVVTLRDSKSGSWAFTSPGAIAAAWKGPRRSEAQLETCAPCHSRRRPIAAPGASGDHFLDHYMPALLEEGLYHSDGQILEEVYEYGSFLQSRMYAAGVVCSD